MTHTTSERAVPPGPATAPTEHARPRLDALDGLRGLAALGVVVLHVWMFTYGDAGHPPKAVLDLVIGELRLGVMVFFVLSGYLIYRPFARAALDGGAPPALGRYVLHRAARILPAYWLALVGGYFLLDRLDHPLQVTAGQLPVFLLFGQNQVVGAAEHLDPPMWTLAVEVSFYLLVPCVAALAIRLGRRRGRQVALCLTLVGAGVIFRVLSVLGAWPSTVTTSLPMHLAEFGAGMTVAVALYGRALRARTGWGLIVAGVALLALNSAWHALGLGPQRWRALAGDGIGVAGMALVLGGLTAAPLRATLLARGPVKWLGAISYGVYLIHFLVIVGLRATGHWPDTLGPALLRVLAWTLPLSAASYYLVERPVVRLVRRHTTTRRRTQHARAAGHIERRVLLTDRA